MWRWWLAYPIHASWHIAAAACGVLAGVALVPLLDSTVFLSTAWLFSASTCLLFVCIRRSWWVLAPMCIGGILLGLWVGASEHHALQRYEAWHGYEVTASGTVADDTVYDPDGNQQIRLSDVAVNEHEMAGEIWVSTSADAMLKRGDNAQFRGELSEGFGNISGSMFEATLTDAQRPEPGDVARQARDHFAEGVRTALSEPQASLGISYLMGQRKALPDTLAEEFRLLGLVHLVVASGFHLTIVVRFMKNSLARVSKYLATSATFTMIGVFLLLTGFSTSMTRAAMVAGLSLLAWYYGRVIHPVILLLFVAALTVLIEPRFLWGDLGWYLSFAAFAGVIILAPLIHRYFWGEQEPGALRYLLVATISAQITTFPVIAFTFGEYSPLALLANLLILPLVPLTMFLTFISGAVGLLMPAIAPYIALPVQGILTYMTSVTSWLVATPWAVRDVQLDIILLIISYAVIAASIVFLMWRTGYTLRQSTIVD